MPKDFDRYDSRQLAGMDYVIWAAKRRGLMLTLTMGNLWNAYRGPEDFLLWATGSIGETSSAGLVFVFYFSMLLLFVFCHAAKHPL